MAYPFAAKAGATFSTSKANPNTRATHFRCTSQTPFLDVGIRRARRSGSIPYALEGDVVLDVLLQGQAGNVVDEFFQAGVAGGLHGLLVLPA